MFCVHIKSSHHFSVAKWYISVTTPMVRPCCLLIPCTCTPDKGLSPKVSTCADAGDVILRHFCSIVARSCFKYTVGNIPAACTGHHNYKIGNGPCHLLCATQATTFTDFDKQRQNISILIIHKCPALYTHFSTLAAAYCNLCIHSWMFTF